MLPLDRRACQECGGAFEVKRYTKIRFCSKACSGRDAHRHRKTPMSGATNPRYNGGLCFYAGRWIICCRDGSILHFARGVMAAELGRLLTSDEIVHHINGDPADDRPDNLEILTRAEHMAVHRHDLHTARGIA